MALGMESPTIWPGVRRPDVAGAHGSDGRTEDFDGINGIVTSSSLSVQGGRITAQESPITSYSEVRFLRPSNALFVLDVAPPWRGCTEKRVSDESHRTRQWLFQDYSSNLTSPFR